MVVFIQQTEGGMRLAQLYFRCNVSGVIAAPRHKTKFCDPVSETLGIQFRIQQRKQQRQKSVIEFKHL